MCEVNRSYEDLKHASLFARDSLTGNLCATLEMVMLILGSTIKAIPGILKDETLVHTQHEHEHALAFASPSCLSSSVEMAYKYDHVYEGFRLVNND